MTLSKKISSFLIILFSSLVLFSSCKKEDPEVVNEEEVITTLTYTLTPESGGTPVVFSFKDLDGDGGAAPIVTGGTLQADTTYIGSIILLNETETPAENITLEIEEEDDEHQFFFAATNGLDATVTYNDNDGTNPIGLSTKMKTNQPSTGKLKITLRHEPNKSAAGVKDGNIANAGGETDIEVEFDVTIE